MAAVGRALLDYVRGPIGALGAILGALLTGIAVVQAVRDGPVWMWLCFAALALFAISLVTYVRDHLRRERSLAARIDEVLREGMRLVDELPGPLPRDATELPLAPDNDAVDRAVVFAARAQELVRESRPSLLPVYAATLNEERRREREAYERQDAVLAESGEREAFRLRRFADRQRSVPRVMVERVLTAVAEVRERVGDG